jgi:putative chitinase
MNMSTEKLAFLMGAGVYSKPIEDACIRWGIIQGRDKARFIAQLYVESAAFKRVEENLNYSAKRLVEVFGKRNGMTLAVAKSIAAAGPRAVANMIYGGEWGREHLGNVHPDDGWDFRGRGLIMLTGRDNYRAASIGCYGDNRLLDEPDMLLLPEVAANVAAWFWYSKHLNGIEDIAVLTRRINGGKEGLDKRRSATNRAYDLLDFLIQH